jgi:nitrilase
MGQNEFDKINQKEQEGSGPIQEFLANTAQKYAVWIVAGTMPIADPHDAPVLCVKAEGTIRISIP